MTKQVVALKGSSSAGPRTFRPNGTDPMRSGPRGERNRKTIVFCEPPYVFWDRSLDGLRKGEETIPGMGVLTLAAVAREQGYRVHLIDAKEQGRPLEEVSLQIAALRPDYVGLSATTISVTNAARIATRVKD